MHIILKIILLSSIYQSCDTPVQILPQDTIPAVITIAYPAPGAAQFQNYLPNIRGKRVGLVGNQASRVGESHLIDTLLAQDVQLLALFAPEHGFRGDADAGAKIDQEVDSKTGLPIHSLYGKTKKPSKEAMQSIDVLLFDLQDVGVRFYTYISTLHYVMEACAEAGVELIVLDRPNPNGFYMDGPLLDTALTSFVGMHPVPIVYGMTIGEYAQMINGEGWLPNKAKAKLKVVTCPTYKHNQTFELPFRPSPNLPNHNSVLLYPSLCLFEGTTISVGRGTDAPFQQIGHPKLSTYTDNFVPKSSFGAKNPLYQDKYCFGISLRLLPIENLIAQQFTLKYLLELYQAADKSNTTFFLDNNFFDKLAGNYLLRKQITSGSTEEAIRSTWAADLEKFSKVRERYLLY